MALYRVEMKITRVHVYEVEAADEDEAIDIVEDGDEGDSVSDQFDAMELHGVTLIEAAIPKQPE